MAEISDSVQNVLHLIMTHLGRTFSLQELILFTAGCRGKKILFERKKVPVAITGYCLALQDVDLIVTRAGMDEILSRATELHEIAHLLLRHLPSLSYGPATPTYAAFRDFANPPDGTFHRDNRYDDPREQDAELLATLLLDCIARKEGSSPEIVKDIHGW